MSSSRRAVQPSSVQRAEGRDSPDSSSRSANDRVSGGRTEKTARRRRCRAKNARWRAVRDPACGRRGRVARRVRPNQPTRRPGGSRGSRDTEASRLSCAHLLHARVEPSDELGCGRPHGALRAQQAGGLGKELRQSRNPPKTFRAARRRTFGAKRKPFAPACQQACRHVLFGGHGARIRPHAG